MFKGTAKNPAGRFSQQLAAIGGQENAFTSNDYTGYFQRIAREHLADADGVRGRPHDRPRAHRRRHRERAQRDPGGAQPAHRERAVGAALRAGAGGAVSQPSLSQADHRLAPRDGDARPRGCARLLQALLRAGQRRAGGRGRRHAGGGEGARREDLRQDRAARPDRRAQAPAGAAADRRAARDLRGPARHPAELAAQLSGAVLHHREGRRGRRARRAGAHPRRRLQQPALPRAGAWSSASPPMPAPGIRARRSMRPRFGLYAHAGGRRRARKGRERDRRRDRGVPRQGTDAPKRSSAPRAA